MYKMPTIAHNLNIEEGVCKMNQSIFDEVYWSPSEE